MRRKQIEAKLIDLVEDTLPAGEREELLAAIEADPELRTLFASYRDLIGVESKVRSEKNELTHGFVVKVMERLEEAERPLFERLFMRYVPRTRYVVSGAIALLAIWVGTREEAVYFSAPELSLEDGMVTEEHPEGAGEPAQVARRIQSSAGGLKQEKKMARDKDVSLVLSPLVSPALPADQSYTAPKAISASVPLGEGGDKIFVPPQFGSEARFATYAENPRISVASEPVSTFSIDVDTASYANMRRFVMSGQLPPRESVRIEEYLNYFTYNYPKQSSEPFKVYPELAPSPFNPKRYLLKLGVKTKDVVESTKPWNLVFLVDVSGSMMAEDKLELLKQALKLLASNMREHDKISIVTYAGDVGTIIEGSSKEKRDEIIQKLDALTSGGSTNGSGGINEAYAIAQRQFIKGGENRIILATDGDFNVGVTSHEELIKLIEAKRAQGVTLTTLGFGHDNLNDGTLEQLADKGNGNYFFIDSFNEARKVFGTELTTTIETVGKDVKVQIEFNPEQVASYRLIGYDNRMLKKEDFKNDQVDAGETGAGQTVTVLYEIALTGSEFAKELETELRYPANKHASVTPTETSSELAFVKVRYKEPEGSQSKELVFPLGKGIAQASVASASEDFKFAASVAAFASTLRESAFSEPVPMDQIAKVARENLGADGEGYRKEFVKLVESAAAIRKVSSPQVSNSIER